MKHLTGSILLATLLGVAACSGHSELLDPVALVVSDAEGIRISLQGDQIRLVNSSAEPVRFAAIERQFFEHALALWCIGGECGAHVAVGQSGSIPLADVSGYESGAREVVVFWWYDRPNASEEEKANGVRRVVVPL